MDGLTNLYILNKQRMYTYMNRLNLIRTGNPEIII